MCKKATQIKRRQCRDGYYIQARYSQGQRYEVLAVEERVKTSVARAEQRGTDTLHREKWEVGRGKS